jgi:single-stranded-DNA-specific exonuclease
MSLGIECLLTEDDAVALEMARALDRLNRERRSIESTMQQQALAAIETTHLDEQDLPHGLCLFDETWHQGVIGLVASRLKERLQRPVIAFAPGPEAGELKGSARSVPGLHIRDCLDTLAARHPGMLAKFGGHAMAAGLSLQRADLERFREAFAAEVARQLCDDTVPGALFTDGALVGADFSLELAESLRRAGPWGQGFPEPVFDGVFTVTSQRTVGERHRKFGLRTPDDRRTLEAIAFNAGETGADLTGARVRAAYRLDVNEYRGTRSLQLVVEYLAAEPAA